METTNNENNLTDINEDVINDVIDDYGAIARNNHGHLITDNKKLTAYYIGYAACMSAVILDSLTQFKDADHFDDAYINFKDIVNGYYQIIVTRRLVAEINNEIDKAKADLEAKKAALSSSTEQDDGQQQES